jgi:competence protein ComEA
MPLTERQVGGVVAVVVIAAMIIAVNLLAPLFPPSPPAAVPFSIGGAGKGAVALAMDGEDKGIFFLPCGATVSDLLKAAGVDFPGQISGEISARKLSAGDRVNLTDGASPAIIVDKMTASQALAMELPFNINSASLDDLILVPGIGEKTASLIISLREKKGGFRSVEELMEIEGIKEKRLAKIKRYFYAGARLENK